MDIVNHTPLVYSLLAMMLIELVKKAENIGFVT